MVFCLLGALAGLGLGWVQYRLLQRLLPRGGSLRAGWLLPLKFLLWAAAIVLGILVDPAFVLSLVGAAVAFYIGCAAAAYFRSR